MAALIQVRVVSRGTDEAVAAIHRLQRAMRGDLVTSTGRQLTAETVSAVQRFTPRARRTGTRTSSNPRTKRMPAGAALWRMWESAVIESIGGRSFKAVVSNRAADTAAGQAILLALEFGASEHIIEPRDAKMLSWVNPSTGRKFLGRATDAQRVVRDSYAMSRQRAGQVFHERVKHPGHAAFGMVRRAENHLQNFVVPIVNQMIVAQLERLWSGYGFGVVPSFSASVRRIS